MGNESCERCHAGIAKMGGARASEMVSGVM